VKSSTSAADRLGIQSIEVGFRIVEALTRADGPQSLKELSAVSGIAPSNCHRYLASLIRVGFVVQDGATSRYDLGPLAMRAGLAALKRLDPVAVGMKALAELVARTGHTALLGVLADQGAVIVRWMNGRHAVRTTLSTGSVLPIATSATGRIFLAFLPPDQTETHLAQERRDGAAIDAASMRAAIRADGIAQVSGDLIPGLSAAAAPILDHNGETSAALTLIGLRDGFGAPAIQQLRDIAADASRELGWFGSTSIQEE
jgi:DNA-binding IclR family transcriptional regulator